MQVPRPRRLWLVWPVAALLILGAIFVAPRRYESNGCLFCGCRKMEKRWLGVNIPQRIWENECSRWVRSLHPDHSNHIWATSSIMLKGWGPGWTVGCATGAGGLMAIHHFRSQLGEQHAREILARYHSELKGEPVSFRRFVRTDLNSLLTNALPAVQQPN